MKNIVFIVGSLREDSLNLQLAKQIIRLIEDICGKEQGLLQTEEANALCAVLPGQKSSGISCRILEYSEIPYMNQDLELPERMPESILQIRQEIMTADGLWIITPEYNYSYPGLLKNLLDWLSRPLDLQSKELRSAISGKRVTVSGVGGKRATEGARGKLCELLRFIGADQLELYTTGFAQPEQAFREDQLILNAEDMERLKNQIIAFLRFMEQDREQSSSL